jgi:hypothetical protein
MKIFTDVRILSNLRELHDGVKFGDRFVRLPDSPINYIIESLSIPYIRMLRFKNER